MPDAFPSNDNDLRNLVERVLNDGYELDREIGRGGMGIVYSAKDRRLKRQVAIKILPPELAYRAEIRSRFLREAETAAQLNHPNIVPIFSVDERDGLVFFVMAFVDGENLAAYLHRAGPMSNRDARRVLTDVAKALAYAHERGVVHRDIKPDNILIDKADGRVSVTDFGIARAVTEGADSRLTATGMAIGTPAYMSPEQSTGDKAVDGRSDLYSLGIVGYQMLTGELPFNANSTPALLVKHLSEVPTPVHERCPGVAPDLGRAVMLLLEKDPANRFANANELVHALETGVVPESKSMTAVPFAANAFVARPASPAMERAYASGAPTPEEEARWRNPEVVKFRKKLAPWLYGGAVSIVLSIFGVVDLVGIWGLYTLWMAWKYAKLWTDGLDWRDVLKEPQDKMFFDVVAEWTDGIRALWDPKKRNEVRERARLRGRSGALFERAGESAPPAALARAPHEFAARFGSYAQSVQGAARNRDEVLNLFGSMQRKDRDLLADVPATANELYNRVESLGLALAEAERALPNTNASEIDREIARLEDEANPLDYQASEERVRRLAQLKRQRRALADVTSKAAGRRERLESCALALENMRLDILRLRAGSQTFEHITSVVAQAASMAREVDTAMYVKDEMAKLRRPSVGSGRS